MSSITIEQFLPYIQPSVIGAPKSVILNEIMGSIIEFCDESGIIEDVLDPVTVEGGSLSFDLDVPSGSVICRVKSLVDSNLNMELDKDEYSLIGDAIRFSAPLPMRLDLVATVSTKPKRASGRCEAVLFEDWHDGICAGALFRLQAMDGREWANPKSALFNEQIYRRSINKAKHYMRTKRVARLGNTQYGPAFYY